MTATFEHQEKEALPLITGEGKEVRLILGNAWAVKTFSEMFYADAVLQPSAKIALPDNHEDRGL